MESPDAKFGAHWDYEPCDWEMQNAQCSMSDEISVEVRQRTSGIDH
jgi:hypothetical protein